MDTKSQKSTPLASLSLKQLPVLIIWLTVHFMPTDPTKNVPMFS